MIKGSCNGVVLSDAQDSQKAQTQIDNFTEVVDNWCSIIKQRLQSSTAEGSDFHITVQDRRVMAGTSAITSGNTPGGLDVTLFNDSCKEITLPTKPAQTCSTTQEIFQHFHYNNKGNDKRSQNAPYKLLKEKSYLEMSLSDCSMNDEPLNKQNNTSSIIYQTNQSHHKLEKAESIGSCLIEDNDTFSCSIRITEDSLDLEEEVKLQTTNPYACFQSRVKPVISKNFLTPLGKNAINCNKFLEDGDSKSSGSSFSRNSFMDSSDYDSIFGSSNNKLDSTLFLRSILKRSASSI